MAKFLPPTVLVLTAVILLTQTVKAVEASNVTSSKVEPLIIHSQVKGSQEQPNVIYIMPWQGVDQVIEVKGKARTISLPHFKPINPRVFKEQVRFFASKQLAVKVAATK
ncbi:MULTISPECIES: hypothetical protein [Colwellia]|uniref:Uncharacterized protein n=1 Tax=Colwellia marinimaniae TaxID=1513592 RepID=A0ABQ0MTV9_9GAMM|nr:MULTISPECIES: hypothetical protein [Colwellia]GAW95803.1 hypothetical protein MTCD1_01406 [Colwellia marinimaniae]